jgi:hypothetical protein
MKVTLGSHKRQHRGPAVLGGPPDPGLPAGLIAGRAPLVPVDPAPAPAVA